MSLGRKYWQTRFRRWPDTGATRPGYTLALPVPGDLAVFTDLALSICAGLSGEHRREIVVIPDSCFDDVARAVDGVQGSFDVPVRVAPVPRLEARLLRARPNPFIAYGLQFVTAAANATATHVIMHDADLFVLDPHMLDGLYAECLDRNLACLGVNQVWDDWFAERGRTIAATWELTFELEWAKQFAPYMHMPRDWQIDDAMHTFDISLYPQYQTPQNRIGLSSSEFSFGHFNHVIGTYRGFQRAGGNFVDRQFRLLLIRLLSDVRGKELPTVPALNELEKALTDHGHRVTFGDSTDPAARTEYQSFREKMDLVLQHPVFDHSQTDQVRDALSPFDAYFGHSAADQPADAI